MAALYEVEVRSFDQAVKRNLERFPVDFMFQLSHEEARSLKSQFVIPNPRTRSRPGLRTRCVSSLAVR
jgi:hypothetical protein